jgi:hypothetical protein
MALAMPKGLLEETSIIAREDRREEDGYLVFPGIRGIIVLVPRE